MARSLLSGKAVLLPILPKKYCLSRFLLLLLRVNVELEQLCAFVLSLLGDCWAILEWIPAKLDCCYCSGGNDDSDAIYFEPSIYYILYCIIHSSLAQQLDQEEVDNGRRHRSSQFDLPLHTNCCLAWQYSYFFWVMAILLLAKAWDWCDVLDSFTC